MSNFRELKIWSEGIGITKHIYELASLLPDTEKYGLKSQICRCAVSIPSNIAEGSSRSSRADFKRFLEISLGSAFELETQLIIIEQLSLVKNFDVKVLIDRLIGEQRMINGLISKLKHSANN